MWQVSAADPERKSPRKSKATSRIELSILKDFVEVLVNVGLEAVDKPVDEPVVVAVREPRTISKC